MNCLALETFSGAACCQATELPRYEAVPLQALGLQHRRFHQEREDDDVGDR
jgi:hypothetical protein